MLKFYFLIIAVITLLFSCNVNKQNSNKEVKHPPNKNNVIDSVYTDTMYSIKEKIYFPLKNYWLDTNKLQIIEVFSLKEIDFLKKINIKWIDINKTINIYSLELNSSPDSSIIYQFMKMLKIIDNSRGKVIYTDFTEAEYDSLHLFSNYFFNFTTQNEIHASDTIKYMFFLDNQKNDINLLAKLDLKITGNDNLNKLKIKYKKIKFEDHVIHQYESVNKYCKNIYFKLQLITYDPMYFERDDYVPYYGKLRFYKFSDER